MASSHRTGIVFWISGLQTSRLRWEGTVTAGANSYFISKREVCAGLQKLLCRICWSLFSVLLMVGILHGFSEHCWGQALKEYANLTGHDEAVFSLAFTPDGRMLASGSGDGIIKLWDLTTNREKITLHGHKDPVEALAFAPDNRTLASSGCRDKIVILWDASTGRQRFTLKGHSKQVTSVAFTPDGKTLAVEQLGRDGETVGCGFWRRAAHH